MHCTRPSSYARSKSGCTSNSISPRILTPPFQSANAHCARARRCRARKDLSAITKASRRESVLGISSICSWITIKQGSAGAVQIGEDAYRKAGAIKRVVKLFMQEEYSKLEAMTAPDAFVLFQSPASLPYSGKYTGRDCVRQFMSRFNESFTITATPEVYQYINESGSVFVAFDFVLKAVENEKEYQTSMTMKIKVNEDLQLTKIAIISDTLAQYKALQG